jgi:asparagine synthase (glutamine-hydrolysing)
LGAIFGYISLNNKPVERETLLTMQQPMLYWGPDGQWLWNEGPAGLGQLQLFNTPESVHEQFPLFDNEQGLVFVSAGRIDNRDELFHKLSIVTNDKTKITDSELIFNSYRKWGKQSVDHLLGDWAFAVWHRHEKKLFLARDHHGITAMYYYHDNEKLVFSTSLKGILALKEVPKELNELRIAEILLSFPGDGIQNCYKNIYRLPPAHHITVSDKSIVKEQYWFLEKAPKIRYSNDNDYIEHFNEIFKEAVRCRLRSYKKVGSTLSSGLDSGSVSAVAANILKEKGVRLPVFTAVPLYEVQSKFPYYRISNEGFFASETCQFNGNMEHFLINSHDKSILEGVKKALSIHNQPISAAGNAYWILTILDSVKIQGCSTLLTGQNGNSTISWPLSLHPKYVESNAFMQSLKKINYLLHHIKSQLANRPQWLDDNVINQSLIEKLNLKEQSKQERYNINIFNINSTILRYKVLRPYSSIVGSLWQEKGAAYEIEVRDPTSDIRNIEYCFSIPKHIYSLRNKNRLLIRKAMCGILPNIVLENNKTGIQSSDNTMRILSETKQWNDLLYSLNHKELIDIINVQKLIVYLQNLDQIKYTQANKYARTLLPRGLISALFIENYKNIY